MKKIVVFLGILLFLSIPMIFYIIQQPKIEASSWKYKILISANVPNRFKEGGEFIPFHEPAGFQKGDFLEKADMTSGMFWSRIITFDDTQTLLAYYDVYEEILSQIIQRANKKEYEYTLIDQIELGDHGFTYTGSIPAKYPMYKIRSLEDTVGIRVDDTTLIEYFIVFYRCDTIVIIEAADPTNEDSMVIDYAYSLDRKIESQICNE